MVMYELLLPTRQRYLNREEKNAERKKTCGLCWENVPENIHNHIFFEKLEVIKREDRSVYGHVFKLNQQMDAGHKLILVIDTREHNDIEPVITVSTLGGSSQNIPLRPSSFNCIEFTKLPSERKLKRRTRKPCETQDWLVLFSVNLAQSGIINLHGNPSYPKCVTVKPGSVGVNAFWKKT